MSNEKITKDNMPFVTPDDNGIRPAGKPDECFYCKQKVGERHLWDCAAVDKKVLVRFELTLEVNVPVSWDREQIEFHYNESSWCGSNIVELVKRNFDKLDDADNCGCNVLGEAKYIKDGDIVEYCNGNSELIPDLEPCPWCKRLPVLTVDNEDAPQKYAYYCDGGSDKEDNHYAETGWHRSEEKAREAWNKRLENK
jgi:hypothetical protein